MNMDGSGGRLNSGDGGMRSMGGQQQQQQRGPGNIYKSHRITNLIRQNHVSMIKHFAIEIFSGVDIDFFKFTMQFVIVLLNMYRNWSQTIYLQL